MVQVNLRDEVKKAVEGEWAGFAQRHPRLAEVMDRELLVEQAVAGIGESAEYREAMEKAAVAGAGAEAIGRIVQGLIGQWLRKLV